MATIDYTANQITRMVRNAVVAQETVGNYAINKYMVPNYFSPDDRSVGDASIFQGYPESGLVHVDPNENAPSGKLIEDWYNSSVYSERRVPGVEPNYDPIVPFSLGKYKFKLVPYSSTIPTGVQVSARIWGQSYLQEDFELFANLNEEVEFEVASLELFSLEVSIIVKVANGNWALYNGFDLYPFICRSEIFDVYKNDLFPYIPDLQTQILSSGGGNPYNESIRTTYVENVQEVTQ